MKINVKAIAKAILILIFLTVLPVIGRQWIPQELVTFLSIQGGFDIIGLLNGVALTGLVWSIFVLLRGHVEKTSAGYLALSSAYKVFWLFIVFSILGFGHPETFGLAVLGGKVETVENTVVFDFRLFAVLATAIVVLMILRSILQYQDNKPRVTNQEPRSNSSARVDAAAAPAE